MSVLHILGSTWIAIGLLWLTWLFGWAPMMWRWHVRLPRAREALLAQPDGPHRRRDLRRIEFQLGHSWAGRRGLSAFTLFTQFLLAVT